MDTATISIVFDVGKVLVDFSFESFREYLNQYGANLSSVDEFVVASKLLSYERGEISDSEFLGNVQAMLSRPAPELVLREKWQQVFSPIPDMLELASALKRRYRVYLLSNTNSLHWSFLEESFALPDRAHGAMTSFRAGAMKPSKRIYEAASSEFMLRGKDTVFIDDIQEHVLAAREFGWTAFQHEHFEATVENLKLLGVTLEHSE